MAQTTDELEHQQIDRLVYLLYWLRHEMHQTYANTSRRGRGIGGQMITPQCNVLHPEAVEHLLLNEVEDAIRYFAEKAGSEGRNLIEDTEPLSWATSIEK